jgi:hypothetical protein
MNHLNLKILHNRILICTFLTKYHSSNEFKKTEMVRECSTYGERRSAYRILVRKFEGRRPCRRPRRRWEDNIKMEFLVVGWRALTGLFWLRIETDGGLL